MIDVYKKNAFNKMGYIALIKYLTFYWILEWNKRE